MAKQTPTKKSKASAWILLAVLLAAIIAVVAFYTKQDMKTPVNQNQPEKIDIPFNKQGELVFLNQQSSDTLAIIGIEVADNDQRRARGLMYRSSLPADGGMLFIFDTEEMQSFWMKNTYISLDMLFVNTDKEIVTIHANTTPMREWSYASTKPALYVLEVNAGFCNQHGVSEGDKIDYVLNK